MGDYQTVHERTKIDPIHRLAMASLEDPYLFPLPAKCEDPWTNTI